MKSSIVLILVATTLTAAVAYANPGAAPGSTNATSVAASALEANGGKDGGNVALEGKDSGRELTPATGKDGGKALVWATGKDGGNVALEAKDGGNVALEAKDGGNVALEAKDGGNVALEAKDAASNIALEAKDGGYAPLGRSAHARVAAASP